MSHELDVQARIAPLMEEERYARPLSRRYHFWWARKMAAMLPPGGSILDIGCGTGILALAEPACRHRLVGLDRSMEMLDRARGRIERMVLASAERLPFRSGAFDAVFARSVFHHLPDPGAGIGEACRVLKPGGTLVLADTHRSLLSALPRRALRGGRRFADSHRNFGCRELRTALSRRFDVRETIFFGYLAYPLLGFPDIADPLRFFPCGDRTARLLIGLDEVIGKIPVLNRLAFGVMIRAVKP